jgi:hypothetical protein
MHHELHRSSLRFLRLSTSAWAFALLVAVFGQVANLTFGASQQFVGAAQLGAQALFGLGCVAAFGTAGVRILSRSSSY